MIDNVANHILTSDAQTVEALMEETYVGDNSKTLNVLFAEATATIGEKISLRRFTKYVLSEDGIIASYIHMGGKIGVLVELKSAGNVDVLQELAFNLSMQVAASKPQVVSITDVDPAQVQSEREILTVQARNEGKPEAVITKMVEGRIHKYYKEVCLLEQEYVRDGSFSIKQVVAQAAKDAGAEIVVTRFVRYEMGEGIEKRQDNFAAEIAEQLKGL